MNQLAFNLKDRALDDLEARYNSWIECMRAEARRIGSFRDVTADDCRSYAKSIGWEPESPHAYGAIFRGKGWACNGFTPSEHPGNHGRVIRKWRWAA